MVPIIHQIIEKAARNLRASCLRRQSAKKPVLLTLRINFFAYDFPMKRLAKTTNQLPQKTAQKGRFVLSVINRAPIGAAIFLSAKSYFARNQFAALISARETTVCEEAFFVLFLWP
jgi:hypothetical protein